MPAFEHGGMIDGTALRGHDRFSNAAAPLDD
jgi:hypothetical protein